MSEAKQSLAWIFFEEKDETFIRKEILNKTISWFYFSSPPKIFLQKILPSREGEGDDPVSLTKIKVTWYLLLYKIYRLVKASGFSSPLEGYLCKKNSLNGYF